MLPTLQAASPGRNGAISQLPASVQVAGPGSSSHGAQGTAMHWLCACLASRKARQRVDIVRVHGRCTTAPEILCRHHRRALSRLLGIARFGSFQRDRILVLQRGALIGTGDFGATNLAVRLAGAGVAIDLEGLSRLIKLPPRLTACAAADLGAAQRSGLASAGVATIASRKACAVRIRLSLGIRSSRPRRRPTHRRSRRSRQLRPNLQGRLPRSRHRRTTEARRARTTRTSSAEGVP